MTTIEYNNDKAQCLKCKGQLAYDARLTQRLPLGFGFAPGSARFQIETVTLKGFRGECMECGEVVFAVQSRRRATRFPRWINARIDAARAVEGVSM